MDPLYAVREDAREAALGRYGLAKTASGWETVKRVVSAPFRSQAPTWQPQSLLGHVGHGAQTVANFTRWGLVGSPIDDWHRFQELRKTMGGTLPALAREYRNWHFGDPVAKGATGWDRVAGHAGQLLNTGATAHDLYQAVTSDPDQRAGNLAAFGAGLVTSPITGRFGILGGGLAHGAITSAVRNAVNGAATPAPAGASATHAVRTVGDKVRDPDTWNGAT